MRQRVEVWALTSERDAGGAFKPAYSHAFTVAGLYEDFKASERVIAGGNRERTLGRISMRYVRGLDTTYRLKIEDKWYEITGVTNPDSRKVYTVCDVVSSKKVAA